MWPGSTPLWKDYNDALELAKKRIGRDAKSRQLILEIASKKFENKRFFQNRNRLNELAVLGAISQYFDNTVELTRLGKDLVQSIKK